MSVWQVQVREQDRVVERQPVPAPVDAAGVSVRLRTCGDIHLTPGQVVQQGSYRITLFESYDAADDTASPDIDALPVSVDGSADAAVASDNADDWPRLEGFQIRGLLGQGGMGTVWHAVQLSTGREVALKTLRGGNFGSRRARARFDREVELLARLEHPHIARLYHSGVYQGAYFYAMERVDGEPLDVYVRRHGLGREAVLALMETIGRAVHAAHERGVIHRDLKPSNILVRHADGQPCVLDFGLATAVMGEPAGAGASASMAGAVAGTLAYMAPEQAAGDGRPADVRVDVYSLGVVLYQLLLQRLPHDGAESAYALQRRIIEHDPPPPRRLDRTIDRDLEAVMLTALHRDPAKRYATAGTFADDLAAYRRGDPVRARPLTLGYLVQKRLRQHKARFAVAAALLACLLSVAGYAYVRVADERDRAEASADIAERTLYQNRLTFAREKLAREEVADAAALLDACPEHLRHWEWRFLRHQADASSHTLALGHQLRALAGDPGSGELVALDDEGRLHAWRPGEDHARRPMPDWSAPAPRLVAFDGTGQRMLAYADGAFTLWHISTGASELVRPWDGPEPLRVALHSAGSVWAVADAAQQLHIFTADASEPVASVAMPADGLHLTFADAGDLAIATDAGHVGHWRNPAASATGPTWFDDDTSYVYALAITPDGQWLASAHRSGNLHGRRIPRADDDAHPAASQHVTHTFHPSGIHALAFGPSGRHLLIGVENGAIHLHRWPEGDTVATGAGHPHAPPLLHSLDARQFVSADSAGRIKVWHRDRLHQGRHALALAQPSLVLNIAPRPDAHVGDRLLLTWPEGLGVWADAGERFEPVDSPYTGQPVATITDDGRRLAHTPSQTSRDIHVLDLADDAPPIHLRHSPGVVRSVAFGPAGRLLAAGSEGDADRVSLWRLPDTQPAHQFAARPPLAFRADGLWLVTAAPDADDLLIWNTATGQRVRTLPGHDHRLVNLALTPDGQHLAAGDAEGWVTVWSTRTGQPVHHWQPNPFGALQAVAFSGDGQRLFTAGQTARLFDTVSGLELMELPDNTGKPYHHVRFDDDRQQILLGGTGHAVVWQLP
ncbi:MAG: serine/threonine-protein kinase [Phycisphaeraceae bacterium]